jgi:hypothetical protein
VLVHQKTLIGGRQTPEKPGAPRQVATWGRLRFLLGRAHSDRDFGGVKPKQVRGALSSNEGVPLTRSGLPTCFGAEALPAPVGATLRRRFPL